MLRCSESRLCRQVIERIARPPRHPPWPFQKDNHEKAYVRGSRRSVRVEGLIGYENVGVAQLNNPDGLMYGIGVGYDFALGRAVLGIEAEASDSTAKIKIPGPDIDAGRDLYVGGRIGTALGAGLIYAKAGYTNARIEVGHFGTNGDGVRVGAGYELPLSGRSFAKVEYRYSNYEQDLSRNQLVAGFGYRF
jgi:outer membrane immunogenic protein